VTDNQLNSIASSANTGGTSPLLDIRDLKIGFDIRDQRLVAVEGFNLRVFAGESVGLVGESGCGKTTTGLAVMRLLAPNAHIMGGQISLDGRNLVDLTEDQMCRVRGSDVALIPQDPLTSLNPTARIGDQIAEGYVMHRGASRAEARRRALEVLDMVEMPQPKERLAQYPFELSGGLRQRVIIAMGLVCSPKLLIADEPTTALDVTIQAQILEILNRLRVELGMGLLLVTHDMGVIAGHTDRVAVMYAGQKVEEAATTELFSSMRHPYTQGLLASVPSMDLAPGARLASIPGSPPDLTTMLEGCRFAPRCANATSACAAPPALEGDDAHRFACFNPVSGPAVPVAISSGGGVYESTVGLVEEVGDTPLLEVRGLVKEFPIKSGLFQRTTAHLHAVNDVTFTIRPGETFGLVGESGSGKSTIGRMLVGIEDPTRGDVIFSGRDVTELRGGELRASRAERQMMFQDPYSSLNPRMTVTEIIREPLAIQHRGTRAEQYERVNELLRAVGLSPEMGQRYPHEFSGGQRQRIGLARAIALNPRLVVADEPVSALDVSVQAQILNLMKDLQAELGLSYLMISHDLAVVRYMADTIGVLYLGKLVEVGPAEQVFTAPSHPYTRALLDAAPIPDPTNTNHNAPLRGELPSAVHLPGGCAFASRCSRASERCTVETPELVEREEVQVACHFPLTATPVTLGSRATG
jgi:oligopeptide/dipeptide ABC transporter ATP-binding protein